MGTNITIDRAERIGSKDLFFLCTTLDYPIPNRHDLISKAVKRPLRKKGCLKRIWRSSKLYYGYMIEVATADNVFDTNPLRWIQGDWAPSKRELGGLPSVI